jgi:hypothetical protein
MLWHCCASLSITELKLQLTSAVGWRNEIMPPCKVDRRRQRSGPRQRRPCGFDRLIALACSAPPKGRKKWTLTLLETAVVQLNIVDRASDNTIGRTLKKTLSVHQAKLALSSR